jgi:hypothetical protein
MRRAGETFFVRRGHRRGKPAGGPDWLVKLSGKRTACLDTPGESATDTDGAISLAALSVAEEESLRYRDRGNAW